jgi:hypothetical protein
MPPSGKFVVYLSILAALAGGCSRSDPAAPKESLAEAETKKPLTPFEPLRVFAEPNEQSSLDAERKEEQRIINAVKPGHWTGVLVQAKANQFDFSGSLASVPQDARQNPIDLERTPFQLSTTRAVALPKGQQKTLETLFFAPRPSPNSAIKASTWIGSRLYDPSGREELASADYLAHMPSFQYHMIVLASDSSRYRYLKVLDSVRPPTEFASAGADDTSYYRAQFPAVGRPLALSTQALCWTGIAVVLWDDVLPSTLVPEQRQALVDWLHWGGQLIVSGPDSLDKLRGSFLEAYLPATGTTAGSLDPAKLAELHAHWTIAGDDGRVLGTRQAAPWSGVELVKHEQAEFLPGTSGLVAERRIGRGRIVLTAFRLSEPELVHWKSYDGFFNACLLRRPPRKYDGRRSVFDYVGRSATWRFDPRLVSNVRIFTRDASDPRLDEEGPKDPTVPAPGIILDQLKAESGVAGWNDFGWISTAARNTLRDAAGISVPKRAFVLKMVGLYLVVVVGLNWLLFRLLGRVEWAWIAVPAIAVGWGVAVVWLAQLDIGFARSQTELAVLEVQGGYGRGHLTRYTALYSSLSTRYDVHFGETSVVAMPFSQDRPLLKGESSERVTMSTVGDRDLAGFPVASNSTGMIHSEQIVDLGGGIVWGARDGQRATIENNTNIKLSGAVVIRRRVDSAGRAIDESAWLGELLPGANATATFGDNKSIEIDAASERDALSRADPPKGALSLRRLFDCAGDHAALEPGDVRLVAWHAGELATMEVRPASSQVRRATLVVAHLERAAPAPPRPDANLRFRTAPPEELF